MPDIIATVGGPSSNSYVTIDEADAYLDARLNASAWNSEDDDDQKARALIEATRELNVLDYSSRKATDTQALQWPRYFATNPDASNFIPWYFPVTVVPQRVKDATCELALEFLKAGATDIAALDPSINVIRKSVDVISTEYAAVSQRRKGLARFPRVWSLIVPLLSGSLGEAPVVRG